jgi:small subunit ribosomal protein S16
VATKIKLMRMGKMRAPYYRIVVADARTKRDGRSIEEIGKYHPKEEPSFIEVDSERVQYWLSVGAQPTEPVAAILRVTGDWQKFKGEPDPPPMRVKEPKADKRAAYEAAARESADAAGEAITPKGGGRSAGRGAADKAASGAQPTADQAATAAGEQGQTLLEARESDAGIGSGPAGQ